ncbi:MAG TPA: proton-conducting transporter membrane subunit [Spirochaetales bacterium]|nr:proton-conducting transporter membrane subunit [Spirochaetales bacterium]
MVNPLWLFALSLGAAFLLPLVDRLGRRIALALVHGVTAAWLAAGIFWLSILLSGGEAMDFGTAGFMAPLAIVLRVGLAEAAGVTAVALTGLLAASSLTRSLRDAPLGGSMALLMVLMGLSGIVLTRDLFNLFVFLEISAIGTYGFLGFDDRKPALRAAFKYMIAGGLASSLYLIGVIYVYRLADTLNLDIAASGTALSGPAGTAAVFFLLAALLVELKPFPANGWAVDAYETAHPGVSAILSGASATALLLALWKILPLLGPAHLSLVAASGLATFAAGNLVGARQDRPLRMLGYSSVAQVGLVAAVAALARLSGLGDGGSDFAAMVAGGLLLNHLLAKTGLFLLAGAVEDDRARGPLSPLALAAAGILSAALVGLPPFPGFWAKWRLVRALADSGRWWILALVLGGSLLEAFYVFRWLGARTKGEAGEAPVRLGIRGAGPVLAALLLVAAGTLGGIRGPVPDLLLWAPWAAAAVLFLLDGIPGRLKGILSAAAAAAFGAAVWGRLDGLGQFFAVMLLGGGALFSIAALRKGGARRGLYPLLSAATLALGAILAARTPLEFFFAWETMTAASWLLVLRGRDGRKPALSYIVFGLGGAFLLMAGLAAGGWDGGTAAAGWPGLLVLAGLLVKAGALGVHVWLPGSYAESDDESSGFLSAALSKAPVFALFALALSLGAALPGGPWTSRVLGWLGLATALGGALYAVYQEDIKRTLAYSSLGQIGYILLAFAAMDQAGWTTSLYLALNHFLYKSMLFLAVAGVIQRTGTRNMYEMGGLIKKMPVSFLSVLMAIIALSGVPPLSGFGGKWLLYSTLIGKGWYLEAAVAFFASGVAFLYLYRLIHSIFLGQPKPSQSEVREAPAALVLPQLLLMAVLMAVSVFPRLMLDPILALVGDRFPTTLAFEGSRLRSALGYWDGTLTMVVTGGVFALCLAWMLANLHNPQSVRQFNIVFAAERPLRPETTHYAWRFFEPYRKALGFLTRERAERFWDAFGTGAASVGGALRRLYTGNGQTYALHVVLYVAILYLLLGVL